MTRTVRAPTAAGTRLPRRLLLLTGSLGGGHHAAARAVEEQARRAWPGVEVTWTETLSTMGPGTGRVFRAVYAGCVRRLPWLYELYFWLLRRVAPFRAGTRMVLGAWSARGLRDAIARHSPDVVVATFPEAAMGLGRLRRRGELPMTAVVLVADPAPHPLWLDPALDLHLVSIAPAVALAQRMAPQARVRLGALPVVAAFHPPQRPRRAGRPRVYVSGGTLAFGDLPLACSAVLAGGGDVVVSCGRVPVMRRRLERLARAHPGRVQVHDWVDDPAALLRDCDAVVTNAGGATALEAIACARPLLLFAPIPGHGRANAAVLTQAGLGWLCPTPRELAAAVAGPLPSPVVPRRDATADMVAIAALRTPRAGARVRPHDALFLHVCPPQQVGACIVVEDADRRDGWPEHLADLVARRAPDTELLCRTLAPPRPGRPLRWVRDPPPDPARHVRRGVLPVQSLDAALTAFLADPLDITDVAWELQAVRDGDRLAVLAKVHHALGDGIALTEALVRLLADDPSALRPPAPPSPHRTRRAGGAIRGIVRLALAGFAGPSPLGAASAESRWVGVRLDGRRVRATARRHGVGTAAVLLAAVAEALVRPSSPGTGALRTMVAVTTRTHAGEGSHASGNRTAALPLDLPVGPMAPAERVRRIATALDAAARTRAAGASAVLTGLGLLPRRVQAAVARLVYGPRFFHAIASVLPGVRRPTRLRGAPITEVYPVLPLAEGVGLAVGAMHWADGTTVGITCAVPGLAEGLPAALRQAFAALAEAP
jgi:UDP-N-acetylglucosamine:LPS N-acetylglucosamine transferase